MGDWPGCRWALGCGRRERRNGPGDRRGLCGNGAWRTWWCLRERGGCSVTCASVVVGDGGRGVREGLSVCKSMTQLIGWAVSRECCRIENNVYTTNCNWQYLLSQSHDVLSRTHFDPQSPALPSPLRSCRIFTDSTAGHSDASCVDAAS